MAQAAGGGQRGLQGYVQQLLTELGGDVSPAGPGLLEAAVPPEAAGIFGGRSYVVLAFDYEAYAEVAGAEYVRPGSPLLDRLAEAGLGIGRLLARCVWLPRVAIPDRMEQRIARALDFGNGRAQRLAGAELVELGYLVFQFRAALVGDERVEWVERVLVDLQRGLPGDGLEQVERSVREPEPAHVLASAARVPFGQAYGSARRVALARGQERAERYAVQARPAKQAEIEKLNHYYDGLRRRLEQRLERAADPEKRRELEQRLAANEADRRRRLEDVERKYRPSLDLSLDQLIWYRVPGVQATVEVLVGRTWRPLVVHYSLLTHTVEPVGCEQCGRRLRSVFLDGAGRPACQAHAGA
ncbi:MAG: hypothetical protein AB1609_02550 [Bacillota bacterium]